MYLWEGLLSAGSFCGPTVSELLCPLAACPLTPSERTAVSLQLSERRGLRPCDRGLPRPQGSVEPTVRTVGAALLDPGFILGVEVRGRHHLLAPSPLSSAGVGKVTVWCRGSPLVQEALAVIVGYSHRA